MFSVENLSKHSSDAAFTAAQGTTLAEDITPSNAHEEKSQSCNGNEESSRDFRLPKNPQNVAESEETNMICGNQQELAMMAQDQALTATFASYAAVAGGGALALPENVPQILYSNNFPTRNSENAVYDDTKIPVVVKRARKCKHKQSSSSPLGASEEKNGGVGIDGNLEKSHMARERKKSKYLSYPYIDPMDETNAGSNEKKEVSNLKSEVDKAKIVNLTSAAILWKLRLTAQSGSHNMERKHSGSVKSFFSCFRRFAFLKLENESSKDLYETELHIERAKESLNCNSPEEQNDEDKTSTDIGSSHMLKNCLYGAVERDSTGTVPDTSKSVTVDKKRKGKTVLGINKANPIKSVTVDKQRKGKTVSGINEADPISRLLDFNANTTTSSAEGSKLTGYVAASGNLEQNSIKMGNPCTTDNPGLSGISGNRVTFVQLLNDVQAGVPNLFQSIVQENKAGKQSSFISNSRQSEAEENQVKSASGNNCSSEEQCVPPGFIPEHKKVGQKLKMEALNFSNNKVAVSAPDGNGIVDESNTIRNCNQIASPDSVPAPKRRGRKKKEEALNIPNDETGVSSQNMNDIESPLPKEKAIKRRKKRNSSDAVPDSNLQNNSAAILMNFTSGFSLPSIESILQAFSGYGIINKTETRYLNDSSAQVVFVRSANAKEAFQRLQTNNPFGPVLGNYLLQPLSASASENNPNDETGVSSQNMKDIESPLPKEKPIKRRKKRNSSDAVPDSNLQNKSAAILLNFTNGFSLPSIESILQAFSGYGIINKSETRYLNDSSAQVVFVRSANAKEAFRSLLTNNPFGPVLGNYLFQPLSGPASENQLQTQHSFPAMNGINVLPAPPGINSKDVESPNLVFIKQKLEIMTSMLEKAGSSLSPEMRAKLESEIRSFTEKVNSMVGSSSS